jgi:hypothetical protein
MSACLSACAQGLQCFITVAILCHQANNPLQKGSWCNYILATFSVFILAGTYLRFKFFVHYSNFTFIYVGAIGELSFGGIIRAELDVSAVTPVPLVVMSNIIGYPNIPLVTGIHLFLYFFLLIGAMLWDHHLFLPLINGSAVLLLAWFLSAYIMTNIGINGPMFAGTGAIVTSLTALTAMAPALVYNEIYRIVDLGEKTPIPIELVEERLDPVL